MTTRNAPIFGVAGNPPSFFISEFGKERVNAPEWLRTVGLDALELQCTRGVRISAERAQLYRDNAIKYGITLSIHGPYYITLGTPDPAKVENSLSELKKCLDLARMIGSTRIVFHPGAIVGTREASRRQAIKTLKRFEAENDVGDVKLLPEVVGKIVQLGSLEDVLAICEDVKCAWPCLDLAHHHARTHGTVRTAEDVDSIFNAVEASLGRQGLENVHFHMYPIEWGDKGEIRHRAFSDQIPREATLFGEERDTEFLPRYEPFLKILFERSLSPVIICEAHDSQDIGAKEMKRHWAALQQRNGSTAAVGSGA